MHNARWIAPVVAGLTAVGGCGDSDGTSTKIRERPASNATVTAAGAKLSPAQQVRALAYEFDTAVSNGDANKACALMRKTGDRACHTLFYREKPQQYVAPVIGVEVQGRKATAKLPVGGFVRLRRDDNAQSWYIVNARMPRGADALP